MKLSDFFPDMEGFTPVDAGVAKTPQLPNQETQVSPFLRATLPLPLQYSGDTIKQYNRPGLSSFRIAPLPPNGIPTIVAASSSTSQASSSSSSGGGTTPSEDVESINVNIQNGTGYNATAGDRNTLISMTNNAGGTVVLPGSTTQGSYFVQKAIAPFNVGASTSVDMINGGGNLLVLVLKAFPGSPVPSDTLGNSYTFICTVTDVGGGTGAMYYVKNCAAGANTITITGAGSSGVILEYTNALTTGSILDEFATVISQQSGFPTVTTNFNTEMAVYGHFVNLGASYTAGAGWTERLATPSSLVEDQSVLSAGTLVVPTFGGASGSSDTLAMLATFRMNPITQNLTAGVPAGWFCYVENTGSGTFFVLGNPSIDGGANTVALGPNEGALFVYDGAAWRSVRGAPELIIPSTFTPITHEFLTGYDGTTGAFSAAQPAFTDLSGNIAVAQMNSGTGASGSTAFFGDNTWKTIPPQMGGVSVKSADYTITTSDAWFLIALSTGTHTFTLPSSPTSKFVVFIENYGTGTLTVSRNGKTIDGAASNLILAQDQGVVIFSDGTNYFTERGMGSGGGGGVSSLNGLTGGLSLTSSDSSITITPSGSTIDLMAVGGGGGGSTFNVNLDGDTHPQTPSAIDDEFEASTLDGKWTQVNSPSISFYLGSAIFTQTGNGGDNIQCIVQTAPSTPYTFGTKMLIEATNTGVPTCVVVVRDSSTGKLSVMQLYYSSGWQLAVSHFTNPTTFSANVFNATLSNLPNGAMPSYFAINDDGTNLNYQVSQDGIQFKTIFSESRTAFLATPDQIGIGIDNQANTVTNYVAFDWFRKLGYTPAIVGIQSSGGNINADIHPSSPNTIDDEFEGQTLNPKWTSFGSGPTLSFSTGSAVFTQTGNGSVNWGGITQPVITAPYQICCKVYLEASANNYSTAGLILRESGSGKIINLAVNYNGGWQVSVFRYTNSTTFSATSFQTAVTNITGGAAPRYLSIVDDGTNYNYQISTNGITWVTVFSESRTAYLTADQFGIGLDNEANTIVASVGFDWFRKFGWTPATNVPTTVNTSGDTHPGSPNPIDDEFEETSLDSKWTQRNSPVFTLKKGSFIMSETGNGSSNPRRMITQPLPSAPYEIGIKISVQSASSNYYAGGIVLYNTGSGKFVEWAIAYNAGWVIGVNNFDNFTTFNSTSQQTALSSFPTPNGQIPLYLSIQDDGTNRIFKFSSDGIAFQTFYSESNTHFITPDAIGIDLLEIANSVLGQVSVDWFRRLS